MAPPARHRRALRDGAGVAERALRMTASYTTTRHQFERPIATFQAVSQRAADAYVDVEAIRVTTWQAAWRLEQDLPAAEAVSTAKLFAAEAGHRVVFAAQHLHGGMGFDVEYPLYRLLPAVQADSSSPSAARASTWRVSARRWPSGADGRRRLRPVDVELLAPPAEDADGAVRLHEERRVHVHLVLPDGDVLPELPLDLADERRRRRCSSRRRWGASSP